MPRVNFTHNLQRHVQCAPADFRATVREVLEAFFRDNAVARGYVLDEQAINNRFQNPCHIFQEVN
jgi:hypothetical protein